jgi:hypothetical protein
MALPLKCRLFRHAWVYKDLTNSIKLNGERYSLSAIRKCKRCEKHQYKYTEWVDDATNKDKDEMVFQYV